MRFTAFLALPMALCQGAFAAPLSLQNPSFAEWIDRQPFPLGWSGRAIDGYEVAKECAVRSPEAGCALRIRGTAGAPAQSLGQWSHPGTAIGHGVVFSARVRTQNVQGRAALWLVVAGPEGTTLAIENKPLSGTHDWQRLEIRLPVAPNARQIGAGVLLHGGGTAWFTDLKLEDDATVDASLQPPARPARTPPPKALLDDASLRLAATDIPPVEAAWRADIKANAHPIRSLVSDDFADLAFLEPLLRGRRVVQLGESSHGVAEFNWIKVRLVKYLHERLGYDVMAFESSAPGCEIADSRIATSTAEAAMRACTFGVWHTDEVLPLFDYLKATRETPRPMRLAGFDIQDSGAAATDVSSMLSAAARRVGDAALAARVDEANRTLRGGIPAQDAARNEAAYAELAGKLQRGDLAERAARARALYVRQLAAGDIHKGGIVRDRGMADLLDELLDQVHPNRKVVVWAHNFHIAKDPQEGHRMMGSWLAERRGHEVYTVGVYMGRGQATKNDRSAYDIAPPPPGSLEAVMANAGWKMSFVDLTRAKEGGWVDTKLVARYAGTVPAQLVPRQAYDAILYIDTVGPPQYR